MEGFLGIDLGGTAVKGGIIDKSGKVLCSGSVPTNAKNGMAAIVDAIAALTKSLVEPFEENGGKVVSLGIGSAGIIDSQEGIVRVASNLGLKDAPLVELVREKTGIKNVFIGNDANAAALGEALFGAGKGLKGDSILLTLGTGVGGGMILNGKIYDGNGGAGAELGHMVIRADGEKCGCGRRGCLEAYCSATSLIRDAKAALQKNPNGKMREASEIAGRTPFDYADSDADAKKIVDAFINNLAVAIGNLLFVFRPSLIILGGGISAQGDKLILPLDAQLKQEMGAFYTPKAELRCATLSNSAGFMGAAALGFSV